MDGLVVLKNVEGTQMLCSEPMDASKTYKLVPVGPRASKVATVEHDPYGHLNADRPEPIVHQGQKWCFWTLIRSISSFLHTQLDARVPHWPPEI